ncbi:hypothetical protein EAG_01056 [Camponotus floridanus]|uniref:CUB domain-containing protein n=1 Tax=Camponotus floridanus TaxID=104421 RepID=E2AB40_CAMFO|nr:hypothetical protein EAG_01056 [Camponotus floridanus]
MCDHEFVSSQSTPHYGRFYSPRYPSSYPKNIRCSYLFRARLKERIRLVFEEILLQKGDLRRVLIAFLLLEFVGEKNAGRKPDKVPGVVTGNPKYSVIGPAVSATNLNVFTHVNLSPNTGVQQQWRWRVETRVAMRAFNQHNGVMRVLEARMEAATLMRHQSLREGPIPIPSSDPPLHATRFGLP